MDKQDTLISNFHRGRLMEILILEDQLGMIVGMRICLDMEMKKGMGVRGDMSLKLKFVEIGLEELGMKKDIEGLLLMRKKKVGMILSR